MYINNSLFKTRARLYQDMLSLLGKSLNQSLSKREEMKYRRLNKYFSKFSINELTKMVASW